MKCPHCGAENKPSANYCLICGQRLSGGNTPSPAAQRTDGANKTMVMPSVGMMGPSTPPAQPAAPPPPPAEPARPVAKTQFVPSTTGAAPSGVERADGRQSTQYVGGAATGAATTPPAAFDPSKPVKGFLVSLSHVPTGEFFTLFAGRNAIGRDPAECTIVLPRDAGVSRKHCSIFIRDNQIYVRDSDSDGGTLVNGEDIGPDSRNLKENDQIRVGTTTLILKLLP